MLKRIINFYKRKKKIANNFMECSEYMVRGKYTFDETLTYIYLQTHHTSERVVDMFGGDTFSVLKFNRFSAKKRFSVKKNLFSLLLTKASLENSILE